MTEVVMGIDGGGSGVRVVIATPDLAICGQSEGPAANPSVIGTDAAAVTIQAAMRAALDAAGLAADQIAAVGIGVAGAATTHSAGWLRQVVAAVMPQARIISSTDYEIWSARSASGAVSWCCPAPARWLTGSTQRASRPWSARGAT